MKHISKISLLSACVTAALLSACGGSGSSSGSIVATPVMPPKTTGNTHSNTGAGNTPLIVGNTGTGSSGAIISTGSGTTGSTTAGTGSSGTATGGSKGSGSSGTATGSSGSVSGTGSSGATTGSSSSSSSAGSSGATTGSGSSTGGSSGSSSSGSGSSGTGVGTGSGSSGSATGTGTGSGSSTSGNSGAGAGAGSSSGTGGSSGTGSSGTSGGTTSGGGTSTGGSSGTTTTPPKPAEPPKFSEKEGKAVNRYGLQEGQAAFNIFYKVAIIKDGKKTVQNLLGETNQDPVLATKLTDEAKQFSDVKITDDTENQRKVYSSEKNGTIYLLDPAAAGFKRQTYGRVVSATGENQGFISVGTIFQLNDKPDAPITATYQGRADANYNDAELTGKMKATLNWGATDKDERSLEIDISDMATKSGQADPKFDIKQKLPWTKAFNSSDKVPQRFEYQQNGELIRANLYGQYGDEVGGVFKKEIEGESYQGGFGGIRQADDKTK